MYAVIALGKKNSSICLYLRLVFSKNKNVSKSNTFSFSLVIERKKTTKYNRMMIDIVTKLMSIVKRNFLFFLFDDRVISS